MFIGKTYTNVDYKLFFSIISVAVVECVRQEYLNKPLQAPLIKSDLAFLKKLVVGDINFNIHVLASIAAGHVTESQQLPKACSDITQVCKDLCIHF